LHTVLDELRKIGIIPVIKIDDAEKAVPLAKALIAGGIPCAEITFRTAQGEKAIAEISKETPGILLGAGTVLTVDQVDKAIAAGAKFIVSPGFNPKVVSHCIEKGIPVTPGCSNPSDIEMALEMGLEVVKFFPAEQAGGLEYIKAIPAPYSSVSLIPTGGINAQNIGKYIAYEKTLACGGSWMVNAELINSGNWEKISALCKEALMSLLAFQMVHIGINSENAEAAGKAANIFSSLFGFQSITGNSSIFAGDSIEIMKSPFYGKNGHIAIAVNSVLRAMAYFQRRGVEFKSESVKTDSKGNPTVAYFKEEIGGFAIHLVNKKQG
jgi:2-dehydro-3-deoxyphosphogluconate aldolase/(4S)-4-hydroxy-2-oxoglutarate aldolase